jgi:cytochrome c oxidase subunit 1
MFQSGMNPALGMTFMVSTMMIALPSAIKTFNWLGTLWRSNMILTPAMQNALAFVSMFVIGGLSGIFMASTPVDIYIHDTYFIVGHIHYVLFGGSMFAIFGAIYYWFPKMFGKMMNSKLGTLHTVLSFIFFNCTFFTMHILGVAGHPRRIAIGWDKVNNIGYEFLKDVQPLNEFMTWSALGLAATQFIFAFNLVISLIAGKKAGNNPWKANTLEWETTSPAPHGNFGPTIPTVYRGPYEYAHPDAGDEDYLPQARNLGKA